jgi:hypothetical protein
LFQFVCNAAAASLDCSGVSVAASADGGALIGSSDAGTSFIWTINGKPLAQGPVPQRGLFHFDGIATNTAGLAPSKATGVAFVSGKWGKALSVAPSGMALYPVAGLLSFGDGTIETWISLQYDGTAPIYTQYDHTILRYVSAKGDQFAFSESNAGKIYGGTTVSKVFSGVTGPSISGWKAGQWHHVALTYSATAKRMRVYVDGLLVAEKLTSLPMPAADGTSFTIASDTWGHASAFDLDEMRISAVEKTADEIRSDAARTAPFANNEVTLSLNGVASGQIGYQVSGGSSATCSPALYTYAPLTNMSPSSGLLVHGSTSVSLSFTSGQSSTCKYSVGSLGDFASMRAFDTLPATSHRGIISGLSADPRVINSVYLRCSDNPSASTQVQYRAVAAPNGSFPRIGSIWCGSYVYSTKPDQAKKIQLYLGGNLAINDANTIRAAEPNVLFLPSINATETTGTVPVVPDDSYYLKDVHGNKIQHWPGNYLLNLTKPQVAEFLAQYANQVLQQGNLAWDGIFFDNFRTTISNVTTDAFGNPVQIDADGNGVPDNPSTLDANWSAGVYHEIETFRSLAPNAYSSGHLGAIPPAPAQLTDFNGDSLVFAPVNVREGTADFGSLYNTYQTWFTSGHAPVITMVQSSPPNQIAYGFGFTPLSQILPATIDFGQTFFPNMRFGLALALMNNGFSTYDFGDTGADVNWWYDEYDFNLGQPLGPATQIGGGGANPNLLTNGNFENGTSPWKLAVTTDGVSSANLTTDTSNVQQGAASAHVNISSASTVNWHVSFEQPNVSLTSGANYVVQFWARADAPRNITVHSQGGAPNYSFYNLSTKIAIDTTWRSYSVSFAANSTVTDARIQFWVGDVAGNVWFDSVSVTKSLPFIYRRDFTNGVALLNGTNQRQTIQVGSGLKKFLGTQAPLYQYIIDDASAGFTSTGTWKTVTYDTGYKTEVATGPYYHAWTGNCHQLDSGSGTAQWKLNIPADGTYTIQAWLPGVTTAGSWTRDAIYEVVSGGSVVASMTIDQTTALSGDAWRPIAALHLTVAGAPYIRVRNGGTGSLIADAIYVTSAALYNDGSAVTQVTLAPMDGILLQRQ